MHFKNFYCMNLFLHTLMAMTMYVKGRFEFIRTVEIKGLYWQLCIPENQFFNITVANGYVYS